MLAMNKKVNILIMSTRDIGKKGTIFERAKRLEKTSESLKGYFWERNREKELKKYVQLGLDTNDVQLTVSNPYALVDFAKDVFRKIQSELGEKDPLLNIRNYWMGIENGVDLDSNYIKLAKQLEQLPKELKTKIVNYDGRFEEARKLYAEGRKSTFELEDFEDEKYLVMPVVNTDNHPLENDRNPDGSEKPLILRDRISLFLVKDPEKNDDSDCYLYAVLTLKDEDDDTNGKKWVDALTLSVIDELDYKDCVDVNLIVMLHDKDMKSTSSETFKTIEDQESLQISTDQKGVRTIQHVAQKKGYLKRSLVVFNHPNHFYRKLTVRKSDEVTVAKIFEEILKGTVYSLNEQRIKDVSRQIATFKEGDDLSSIKTKCEGINIDVKEDVVETKNELITLFDSSPDGATLITANGKINDLIRYYSSLIYGTNEMN